MAMTDREKRARLDERMRRNHPNSTPEQIHALREAHVKEKYGKYVTITLPLPEARWIPAEALTLEKLTREAVREKKFFEGPGIFLVVFLPIPAIFAFMGLVTKAYDVVWTWIFLALAILVLVSGIAWLIRDRKEKRYMQTQMPRGNVELVHYTVADMENRDTGSSDDVDIRYWLYLTGGSLTEPWVCECTKDQYERTREGDTVYLVYFENPKEHCFLFSEEAWLPDEDVRRLMDCAREP